MKAIWKFPMPSWDSSIAMPKGANVLCVQMQGNLPCLWAEVETEAPQVNRTFAAIGTGHQLRGGLKQYVGTVQAGDLVWHIYESE
jgi:hypothetical protein